MCYKKLVKMSFVLLLSLTVSAPAAIYNQWTGGAGTTDWNTPANWNLGYVPFADNGVDQIKAGFKTATGAVIDSGTTNAEAYQIIIGGSGGVGELTLDGGSVWVGDYIIIGNRDVETGTLYMNSGTITTIGHFYCGFNGPGTIYMDDGNINVGNIFGIAEKGVATSVGTVYLHGGTITSNLFQMENVGPLAVGLLEIANDGKLVVNGDIVSKVTGYIGNGFITGVGGAVQVDYDVTTPGKTTVYIPEPATLLTLGLGSLVLYRRKK